jgi:peptidoglycan/xylan/chitin deacetylase (PgdA/CDA1 family)
MNKRITLSLLAVLVAAIAIIVGQARGATKPAIIFVTAAQTTTAGQTSSLITVSLQNGATGPATVKLTSSAATGLFRNGDDTQSVTSVTVPSGQTQTSFHYRDTKAGQATVTVSAASTASPKQWTGNMSATQVETTRAAAPAALTLSPATASINSGGSQAYTATGTDAFGNANGNVTAQTSFSISPNGSCAAATCTAQAVGSHTVTGVDGSASGQATLSVTSGALDHIVVSPGSAQITAGGSKSFTVEGFDTAGNSLGDETSSASFAISPDGSCSANSCGATKTGNHTVTATVAAKTDTAQLSVSTAGFDHIAISPQTATIGSDASQTYSAEGFDQFGNDIGDVTAQTSFAITPDGSCSASACSASQAGTHTVTASNGTSTDTATLNVTAGAPNQITITPTQASISAGGSQSFTVEAFDSGGNDLGDVTSQATFTISPNGSCSANNCTAASTGGHTVTASEGGLSAQASLQVTSGGLSQLVISPSSASIASGGSQDYSAEGFDQNGNDLGDVTAQTTFAIAPNGSCQGATCSATEAGSHTVTATDGAASDTATLTVAAGTLDHLVVSPSSSSIQIFTSQTYTAEGFDSNGNDLGDMTSQASFTMSPDGSCQGATCTPSASGAHTVTATLGQASGQAALQVNGSGDPVTVSLTFDDGTADQTGYLPILNSHNMHGTFFIISGRVGTSGNLSLSNLQSLADAGNEIGDHTVTHLNLTTVDTNEATRQVCNARVQLMNWGFHVWDFAYPQGSASPALEQIVQNCNLNSARKSFDLVSPGTCTGCPYADQIPPTDPYAISTPDSVKTAWSLQDIESLVTQAQAHGGGWVPITFHKICETNCDTESISSSKFGAFLDWLQSQQGNGVSVKTVHQVIGGPELPPVTGPAPVQNAGDPIQNESLEADQNGNGVPDCWTVGGSGTNTFTAQMTNDDHSGSFAEQLSINSFGSGDRRLVTTQDLGQCAPPVTPNDSYTASGWIKGSGTVVWDAYTRNSQGAWTFWKASSAINMTSNYQHVSWAIPRLPAGAEAISVGFSLRSVGSFTADDFALDDNGPADVTGPQVAISSPQTTDPLTSFQQGSTVTIHATATDNVAVSNVRFFVDGTSVGSKAAPTSGSDYTWNLNTSPLTVGTHTLSAVATDSSSNQTTSPAQTIRIDTDTTPPVTTIKCNGSSTCASWYKASVAISFTTNETAYTYYTLDGSTPSPTNGTLYTPGSSVTVSASPTTVRYMSMDVANNQETARSQLIQIDTVAPVTQIISPASGTSATGTSVNFSATASDNVSVTSVRFFMDGVSLGSKASPTVAGGSTYKWNWDTTAASKGQHTLTVVATDLAGNTTTSAAVTVTVT